MKKNIFKNLLLLFLAFSFFLLNACSPKLHQTEDMVNVQRKLLNENIDRLHQEQYIDAEEWEQLRLKLNEELDFYLSHQDLEFEDLKQMFLKTVGSLEGMDLDTHVFTEVSRAYDIISGQIDFENLAKKIESLDTQVEVKMDQFMNEWYLDYQGIGKKIEEILSNIDVLTAGKIFTAVLSGDMSDVEGIMSEINQDLGLDEELLKSRVAVGVKKLDQFAEMDEGNLRELLQNFGKMLDIEINEEVLELFKGMEEAKGEN